jgi:alkanesulfonate monooxygenase SsuD/methylene tetrahydromethanopterin reductase-like flavin-dependent oxidoreductase (luciferase family)
MRLITLRYAGSCQACDMDIPAGAEAVYERRAGIWCQRCAPTDPEDIRAVRQEAADRKAERYEAWADKREQTAGATLDTINNRYRGDFAFNTQPGHIPERARVIRREDRAFESLGVAQRLRRKADSLRQVAVAGDAERAREARRELARAWVRVGMLVYTTYGRGYVKKIHRKTVAISLLDGERTVNEGLHWIRQ